MSLWVAVPSALGAAVAYGLATAVQHREAHLDGPAAGGRADPRRLVTLLGNPRWLLSIGGDSLGLVLQVLALATGPVVLVQPLLVLALPVALPAGWALGGRRPDRADLVSCALIIAALAGFFALVRHPGVGHAPTAAATLALLVAAPAAGLVCGLAVRDRSARLRAVVYGAVAGSAFGVVGVLVNAVAGEIGHRGVRGVTHPAGALALAGVVVIGAAAVVLTQVSFQIGDLAASFPANESAAPVVAVVLGAILLGERVPVSFGLMVAYLGCLAAVVVGTIRLSGRRQQSTASA